MANMIKLKHYCEEIFGEYYIIDFKIENDEIILKIKRKKNLDYFIKMIEELSKPFKNMPQLSQLKN